VVIIHNWNSKTQDFI